MAGGTRDRAKKPTKAGSTAKPRPSRPLEAVLIPFGIACMIAAIVAGRLKAASISFPAVDSFPRQLELFGLGMVLTLGGTATRWAPPLLARYRERAAPAPPIPSTTLPPDPSPHFVGRETELKRLGELLTSSRRAAISGLGGMGKSQLAVQYLDRHRSDYPAGIFWLRGEDPAVLTGELANLSWRLQLPERTERDEEQAIRAVVRWLQEHEGWLLVVDNLNRQAVSVLDHWLPPGLPGHLLATSRHPLWGAPLPPLEPLPRELAARFLLDRSGQVDIQAAAQLAIRLDGLPLAIEQAAAYLQQTGESLTGLLKLLEDDPAEALSQGKLDRELAPVARTWAVSFQRVQRASPAAIEVLRLCAFYAPDDIPLSLLKAAALKLSRRSKLRRALLNRSALNRALAVLLDYSLIKRQSELVSVHRLVQDVVRLSMGENRCRDWAGTAILALNEILPYGWEFGNWSTCQPLLPHALASTGLAVGLGADLLATARAMAAAESYLHAIGQMPAARPLAERALAIREQVLGPDHPGTAQSLNSLAALLQAQGELAAARPLFERALAIRERVLGPDHPGTAQSLNNLAGLLKDQGELAAGRPLFERALAITERVKGPDHPDTASSLNNLAALLRAQGELAAARLLFERALAIWERVLGPDHPNTASSLNNLAVLLHEQAELAAARPLFERALAIRERALGPDHPDTAQSLNNLAYLLQDQGALAAPRPLLERALAIRERVLGPDHPDTAQSLNNLAYLLQDQGEQAAARPLHERALAIRERVLGPDHHDTASVRASLRALRSRGGGRGWAAWLAPCARSHVATCRRRSSHRTKRLRRAGEGLSRLRPPSRRRGWGRAAPFAIFSDLDEPTATAIGGAPSLSCAAATVGLALQGAR